MTNHTAENIYTDINSFFTSMYLDVTVTPEDAHFASARAAELEEVSPFVLYRDGANGQPVMEDTFVPGLLRKIAEALPKTHSAEEQIAVLESARKLALPTTSPIDVLNGKLGDEESRQFLLGALDVLQMILDGQLRRTER